MPFGAKYEAATLRGYQELQARLHSLTPQGLLKGLQTQALREQKMLLYTTAIHRKTGHTGQLIIAGPVSETVMTIYARGLAVLAETGTKPHEITPKAKLALRWATSSSMGFRLTGRPSSAKGNQIGWQFATVVHHPGTKPHEYLIAGMKKAVVGAGLADRLVDQWNAAA